MQSSSNMEQNPKVSVIIVTYNQERTVRRAIESVLSQITEFPYEIIIGDDCSSDLTYDICKDFVTKHPDRIHLHRNEVNQGVQANYFDSLLRCRGKYIADCAGDDFWIDPYKLQKEIDILDKNKNVVLVHTGWEYYNESTKMTRPSDIHQFRKPYLSPLAERGTLLLPIIQHKAAPIIHLCTAVYRKKTLMEYYHADSDLFRNPEFGCEDLQISACMAHAGEIAYIPDITLDYNIGASSIMSEDNPLKTYRFYKRTLALIERLCDKFGIAPRLLQECYTDRINHLYSQAFALHDKALIAEAKQLAAHYRVPLLPKNRIKELLTMNSGLWSLFLKHK